jgi:hypothetical protein
MEFFLFGLRRGRGDEGFFVEGEDDGGEVFHGRFLMRL